MAEIKLIEEGFSSAKSNFDERREVISTEKNIYDNGTNTLYQSWKGQAMNACISITDKLNTDYISIIDRGTADIHVKTGHMLDSVSRL